MLMCSKWVEQRFVEPTLLLRISTINRLLSN
jgi:hypothetical protein